MKKKDKYKNVNSGLVDVAVEARKAGMSYGQYVSSIYSAKTVHSELTKEKMRPVNKESNKGL